MSHRTTVAVEVLHPKLMEKAVNELKKKGINVLFETNGTAREYGSKRTKCAFVVGVPDARFDLGFSEHKEGNKTVYKPFTDFYDGGVARVLGVPLTDEMRKDGISYEEAAIGKLLQSYAKMVMLDTAAKKGMAVNSTSEKDGKVVIRLAA